MIFYIKSPWHSIEPLYYVFSIPTLYKDVTLGEGAGSNIYYMFINVKNISDKNMDRNNNKIVLWSFR